MVRDNSLVSMEEPGNPPLKTFLLLKFAIQFSPLKSDSVINIIVFHLHSFDLFNLFDVLQVVI